MFCGAIAVPSPFKNIPSEYMKELIDILVNIYSCPLDDVYKTVS